MARATTKADLIRGAQENYSQLIQLMDSMTAQELAKPFDFSSDPKKKEAHWGRDRNLRDVVIHLYEWHQLLLNWVLANIRGERQPFIPLPYNWKTYGDMNRGFWEKHQSTALQDALSMLQQSHGEVMALADRFSNEALFEKDAFPWVGGSTLGSYFVSATASHYDWAMKKLKAHQRNCRAL